MAILPPYLKKGDTIGIVCPAGYMPLEKAETCINVLKKWGYKVKIGKTLGSQFNYFSATDEERLNDLQEMLDDESVQAILCGRGGYGTGRIIDQLNFKKFRKKPKWIIGYSDITVLHSHLYSRYKIASIHAPMAAAFNDEEYKNEYVQSLRKALTGKKASYKCEVHKYNKTGEAKGELVGGNLSLIAHLIGTPSDINTKNKMLFLEDIGEYLYNIDRMMYQLLRSGKLKNLSALIIGGFSEMKDTTVPYGQQVFEVINKIVKEFDFPVCYNFPVSHERENYALKVGVDYALRITNKKVELTEC
ncbi:MAG TPA: LD-carboxypeptidase [Segetibacter sp.]|jgi:muramoyltetrapeptide carboxypeptidase